MGDKLLKKKEHCSSAVLLKNGTKDNGFQEMIIIPYI